ncbi:MAG: hypothetical protein LUG62_10400 [Clostridiales bacterium]|nr:hypothetical protein [Clostridiales bacterium]
MSKTIEWIMRSWEGYWGDGLIFVLLLVSIVGLLIFRGKKRIVQLFIGYVALTVFLYFCPWTAKIIMNCIGRSVYWRVLWMIPLIPFLSGTGAELIRNHNPLAARGIIAALVIALVVISGESVWQAGNYELVDNAQKVPDDVVRVCDAIRENSGEAEICLATDDHLATYVRIYDPSILMPYGRRGKGAENNKSEDLYDEIMSGDVDFERVGELARSLQCDYLAVKIYSTESLEEIKSTGYSLVRIVGQYYILHYDSSWEEDTEY